MKLAPRRVQVEKNSERILRSGHENNRVGRVTDQAEGRCQTTIKVSTPLKSCSRNYLDNISDISAKVDSWRTKPERLKKSKTVEQLEKKLRTEKMLGEVNSLLEIAEKDSTMRYSRSYLKSVKTVLNKCLENDEYPSLKKDKRPDSKTLTLSNFEASINLRIKSVDSRKRRKKSKYLEKPPSRRPLSKVRKLTSFWNEKLKTPIDSRITSRTGSCSDLVQKKLFKKEILLEPDGVAEEPTLKPSQLRRSKNQLQEESFDKKKRMDSVVCRLERLLKDLPADENKSFGKYETPESFESDESVKNYEEKFEALPKKIYNIIRSGHIHRLLYKQFICYTYKLKETTCTVSIFDLTLSLGPTFPLTFTSEQNEHEATLYRDKIDYFKGQIEKLEVLTNIDNKHLTAFISLYNSDFELKSDEVRNFFYTITNNLQKQGMLNNSLCLTKSKQNFLRLHLAECLPWFAFGFSLIVSILIYVVKNI